MYYFCGIINQLTKYMEVKIKKLNENAVIPRYAHPTDAGLDLVEVDELSESDRGEGGYGSTGK